METIIKTLSTGNADGLSNGCRLQDTVVMQVTLGPRVNIVAKSSRHLIMTIVLVKGGTVHRNITVSYQTGKHLYH